LDTTALACLADAFEIYVCVVSVVRGDILVYHLGDVHREDNRIILLTLAHGHWGIIPRREGYYWPRWWFHIRPSHLERGDALLGGMLHSHPALVDASTAALQLVGGADVAADDDEMAGSVSK
jgi:hypothetical protein